MKLKPLFAFLFFLLFSLRGNSQTAYFPVKVNGHWGLINVQGKLVVKPNYRYIPFEVSPGKFYVMDTNYNEIIIGRNGLFLDSVRYEEDTPWSAIDGPGLKYNEGYTDQYGKVIFKLDTVVEGLPFENGLARIVTKGEYPQYDWDDNAGYIDKTGKFVIPPIYGKFDLDDYFQDGIIRFESGTYEGFLNKKGDTVISPLYDQIKDFSEGFASVEIDNKHNFIDRKGKIISAIWYESVSDFSDGLALVGNYTDHLPSEYMNTKGEIAFRLDTNVFDSYWRYDFHEGLAPIQLKNNKDMVYIDKTGKIALSGPFHNAGKFSEGYAQVWDTNGVYFIDKTGKAITQQRFDDADDFSNGLAAVFTGEDVGMRGTGCVVADTGYRFHSGSLFTGDLKMGYINKQGIVVWKPTN